MRLLAASTLACSALLAQPLVRAVSVPGTQLDVNLATQVGRPFDSRNVEHDVRYLWNLRRFEDVRVETKEISGAGVAVVFRTVPRQFFTIHQVSFLPNAHRLQSSLPDGARIRREDAQRAAIDTRKQLQERGFPNASVNYELVPVARGQFDLKLNIEAGDALKVDAVEFTGNTMVPTAELRHQLRALRSRRILPGIPYVWSGWVLRPSYSAEAVESDAARLHSYYFFRGYPDAQVEGSAGGRQVTFEVDAGAHSAHVPRNFCAELFAARRSAEREGVLDFSAAADVNAAGRVTWSTELGRPYTLGRIDFRGNRHTSDSFLRRSFVLSEGEPLDEGLLHRSVARINRSNRFAHLDEHSVEILRNPETGIANIRIRVTEQRHGSWSISGPVGPPSLAGPLRASIGMRLPSWGSGILELSTYTASLSVFGFAHPIVPILGAANSHLWLPSLALQRPYTAGEGWRSGFLIAPQLGARLIGTGYAATQVIERIIPLVNGDRGLVPELPVTLHRPAGDSVVMCTPPSQKLRGAAVLAIQSLGALAGL